MKRLPVAVRDAAAAAIEKQADDVLVLDVRSDIAFTDFFVLASGRNQRQLVAIADAVEEALRGRRLRPNHVEGYPRQEWLLMDYGAFVVHLFTPATRELYGLERLWGDAPRLAMSE